MIDIYSVIVVIVLLFMATPWVIHMVEQKLGIKHEPETDEE
jgi:hypothetical protein